MFRNPHRGPMPGDLTLTTEPLDFHRRLPDYRPTPLLELPAIAERLGLKRLLVKDESHRFGLPSFKLLGASWASYRAIAAHLGRDPDPWEDIDDLAQSLSAMKPFTLAAATDGNHGRAVARVARWLGFASHIFVPRGTAKARIRGIESEGALCTIVDGDYDAAIARSAKEASERCLVISDVSWPGYQDVPRWVIEGYATIFWEIEGELQSRVLGTADVAFIQVGVGALAAAAVSFYRRDSAEAPVLLAAEPVRAACLLASLRAGKIVTVPGPHDSILAGLNCGTPSPLAFPTLQAGLDGCVAVEDADAEEAMRELASMGIVSGETGAAGLAGLAVLSRGSRSDRELLDSDSDKTVLLISTEGATDPESYQRIVGKPPQSVARGRKGGLE